MTHNYYRCIKPFVVYYPKANEFVTLKKYTIIELISAADRSGSVSMSTIRDLECNIFECDTGKLMSNYTSGLSALEILALQSDE